MTPKLIIVVAVARNGVIGAENTLPWRVSSDLKRFKALTMGKPLIIGRRTWDSLERPLPGRDIIVMTRDHDFALDGAHLAHSAPEALATARRIAALSGAQEIVIGGGRAVFEAFLDEVETIYFTEIWLEPRGDVFFPRLDPDEWVEVGRETPAPGPRDEAEFAFVRLDRRRR